MAESQAIKESIHRERNTEELGKATQGKGSKQRNRRGKKPRNENNET